MKVVDVCCRENVGWINIRNPVPAGLSHTDDYLYVKNRKEGPALETEELIQLLAKWGLRDVLNLSVLNKPISNKLGFALAERLSLMVRFATDPLRNLFDLVKCLASDKFAQHPALQVTTAYEQSFASMNLEYHYSNEEKRVRCRVQHHLDNA